LYETIPNFFNEDNEYAYDFTGCELPKEVKEYNTN
jgi:hypothetical protein